MNTYISLLRGINVSGQKKMPMAALKSLYESLGFAHVETYVQSGNVIFDTGQPDASKLAALIEAQIERTFGYAVSVLVRDARDFQRIVHGNPFVNERNADSGKLYVTFLYAAPPETKLNHLIAPNAGADEFRVGDREIFLFCPNGYGRTKLSNSFFERKLNVSATTRNWKTVNALHTMAVER